jgi:thiamine pyrophosphokinase
MPEKVKVFCGPNDGSLRPLYFEEAGDYLVGVDSGLDFLVENHLPIDLAIGDFDSVKPKNLEWALQTARTVVRLDPAKNVTDLAFAIDYLYNSMEYRSITVYGGISGRVDHFLANLNLLKKYDLSFRDGHTVMFALRKGRHRIENFHRYISFFAIEDVFDLTLEGFDYELDHYYLGTDDSLCVSNGGSGEIAFSKGRILVIMTDDPFPR